jgi:hypothetical protein
VIRLLCAGIMITVLCFVVRTIVLCVGITVIVLCAVIMVIIMCLGIKKVKWSRYRPGLAQRVGRCIALLFHDCGTRRGWVVSSTPRPQFTLGKDPVPTLQEAGWNVSWYIMKIYCGFLLLLYCIVCWYYVNCIVCFAVIILCVGIVIIVLLWVLW